MSEHREVDDLVNDIQEDLVTEVQVSAEEGVNAALKEIATLLSGTGDSLFSICSEIESATSREDCRRGFRKFNNILRLIMVAATDESSDHIIRRAIVTLKPSPRLESLLVNQDTVAEGVAAYKKLVLQDLARKIRLGKKSAVVSDDLDDDLFARFLPVQPHLQSTQIYTTELKDSNISEFVGVKVASKRSASQSLTVPELSVIPKKKKRSSVPALASLTFLDGDDGGVTRTKRALLTRAKLRAARHDPRGLLDLSGPTTNALDRTKELELLKSAGYDFFA